MAKKPETLEDALAAIDRLEKVVARQAARLDDLIDNDIRTLYRLAGEADDTANFTLARTDELGDEKLSKGRVQSEVRLLNPQKVERVRVGGKVRTRIAR
jgi:muconolactone delta-isomerase